MSSEIFDHTKSIFNNTDVIDANTIKTHLKTCDLPKKQVKQLESMEIPLKNTNSKLGENTMVINTQCAFNCVSAKNGFCEHCPTGLGGSCYAFVHENGFKNTLTQNMVFEVLFEQLDAKTIIKQIKPFIKSNDIKFIRFNDSGDFKDIDAFKKAETIAEAVFKEFGVISYCYTHNKNLSVEYLAKSRIVVNFSYNTGVNGVKSCVTAFKWDTKYLDNSKYCICTGDCPNCSYCKDKDDKRIVVFMVHGKDFKGLEALPKGLINVLKDITGSDLAKFNSKCVNPNQLTLEDFL